MKIVPLLALLFSVPAFAGIDTAALEAGGGARGNAYQNVPGEHQNITAIGLTPTFRFQRDSARGWYAEAAIGYHLLSELYDNDGNELSTAFQFGDHVGVGYVFQNGWDAALKVQHFSNGGIKRPNSGVKFLVLRVALPF